MHHHEEHTILAAKITARKYRLPNMLTSEWIAYNASVFTIMKLITMKCNWLQ